MVRKLIHSRLAFLVLGLVLGAGWVMHAQGTASDFDKWWTPATDALAVAPQHHKLIFENDEVRVLEVSIAPGVTEPVHAHRYASLLYDENPAHVIEHFPDGSTFDRGTRPKGGARWLPIGQPHALQNVDTTAVKVIRVELKKAR